MGPALDPLAMHGNGKEGILVPAEPSEITCESTLTRNCGGVSLKLSEENPTHIQIACTHFISDTYNRNHAHAMHFIIY